MSVVEGAIVYSNLLVLLSVGLTLTYITTGVPNFAQGSFAVFGSYISLSLLRILNLHPYQSIPVSFVLGGLMGLAVYILMLKPLIRREASIVILMISTLALDLVLLGILGSYSDYLAGITHKSASRFIFIQYDFNIFGVSGILFISSLVIFISLFGLFLLLYKTKFGVALRASMENPDLAEVMGVNVEYTRLFSWFLSGALAAMAGVLLPFRQEIFPSTGAIIIVSIFAASIIGGLSNINGALVGGYIIGFSESYLTYNLAAVFGTGVLLYSKVISLVVLVAMLIVAPTGITGINWRRLVWKRLSSQ
ncbi:branched-chain amino acid ABC transporter permease [Archaeoglobus neptunius]|uniref:branched-chain amino acid ABC transporter permease n=1 Tax=Archaeoglobus neptunius TaxID=2798580 RepID=UPI0019255443|nr:branched-chain amino acid ABC transporter permease [Archaeoglobus neptunius]